MIEQMVNFEVRRSLIQAMETDSDRSPSLINQTVFERAGVRGPNSLALLESIGLPVPAKPNTATVTETGELLLRLSNTECWLLSLRAGMNEKVNLLREAVQNAEGVYSLYCQYSHAQLSLTGELSLTGNNLSAIMAKVCGVDLRENAFPTGSIAQTSIARVNAIVVRHQSEEQEQFVILSDITTSEYLWEALLDAMAEFQESY